MTKIKVGDGEDARVLTKEKLERIIEIYKVQNPVKYAAKKEALDRQLAVLGGKVEKQEKEAPKTEEVDPVAPKAPKGK